MKKAMMSFMILMLMAINSQAIAQEINYLNKVNESFTLESHKPHYESYLLNASNEFEVVFASLFLFYKTFISSQDLNSCVFTPSCSVYAMQSIQKQGILKGFPNAMDRLTRCHSFAGKDDQYPYDIEKMKFYDPVD